MLYLCVHCCIQYRITVLVFVFFFCLSFSAAWWQDVAESCARLQWKAVCVYSSGWPVQGYWRRRSCSGSGCSPSLCCSWSGPRWCAHSSDWSWWDMMERKDVGEVKKKSHSEEKQQQLACRESAVEIVLSACPLMRQWIYSVQFAVKDVGSKVHTEW